MTLQDAFTSPVNKEELWLFGFRIDPDRESPDVYTLILHGDKDRPLVADGQIVFFSRLELASSALNLGGIDIEQLGSVPKDVDLLCDLAKTLYLINSENIDPSATILNCLNTVFDLVRATGLSVPIQYKRVLYALADHLTFNREFSNFLFQENIARSTITDAILWCIGAIVSKAKLLRE